MVIYYLPTRYNFNKFKFKNFRFKYPQNSEQLTEFLKICMALNINSFENLR